MPKNVHCNLPFTFAWSRFIYSENASIFDYTGSRKGSGRSVRCIESVASADFTGNPTVGMVPLTVNFTDHSLNSPTSWQWSFGDGNTSTEQNPQHTYEDPGTYTVELTIENNYSTDTEVKTDYITVIDAPDIIYGDGVEDIDGNDYVTVIIGSQEWMAEDLRVTRYNNGDEIPTDLDNSDWANTSIGAYAIYPYEYVGGVFSDEEMVEAYGKLYNWYAVDDARKLCPAGWSVPSNDDWTQLVDYIVAQGYPNDLYNPNGAGNALKSCRQMGSPLGGDCDTSVHPRWGYDDTHFGFDGFGLSLLAGGFRRTIGAFSSIAYWGNWWTSSESSSTTAWTHFIGSDFGFVFYSDQGPQNSGYNVRCVKDIDN